MSFVGDAIASITNPILGKPSADQTSAATNTSLSLSAQQLAAMQKALGMSQDYYNTTAPLRSNLINRYSSFLQGDNDPVASALYAPLKNNAEQQFETAERSLMSKLPSGGALQEGISDLYAQKADTLSSLMGTLIQNEYNKAYSMAQGSPATAGSLLQAGGSGQNNLLQQLSMMQNTGLQTANQYGSLLAYLNTLLA
jgi:hypothetical protein